MNRTILTWLLLIVAIGFGIGVLEPKVQDVRSTNQELQAKTIMVTNRKARIGALQTLQQTFGSQPDRITNLISTLPQDPQIPELLITIESMANQSGIGLQSILPQVNTQQHEVDLTLIGGGELGSVENLVHAVGDNARPMSVSSVTLTKDAGTSTHLSFTMVIAAPYGIGPSSKASGS